MVNSTEKKWYSSIVIVFLCVLMAAVFSGCQSYEDAKAKMFPTTPIASEANLSCPVLNCGENVDAVIYYFDSDVAFGLSQFINSANDKLDCAIQKFELDNFSQQIFAKQNDTEVRLLLDTRVTMDCTGGCVPFSASRYNFFYSNSFSIGVVDNLHENFCVSEQGVYIFTKNLDNSNDLEHGLFLKSSGLRNVYQNRFDSLWGKKR